MPPLSAGLFGDVFLLVFAVGLGVRATRAVRKALSGERDRLHERDRRAGEMGR